MSELVGPVRGPDEPRIIDDRPMAFGFLLGYIDLALRGIQEYDRYQPLVLGPWLEIERPVRSPGLREWNRTAEWHQPPRPPQLLGSLRVRMDFRERRPRKRRGTDATKPARPANRRFDLRLGMPRIALFVEADDDGRADRLAEVARDVEERFRRQLD